MHFQSPCNLWLKNQSHSLLDRLLQQRWMKREKQQNPMVIHDTIHYMEGKNAWSGKSSLTGPMLCSVKKT